MLRLKLVPKWILKFRISMLVLSLASYFYIIMVPIEASNGTNEVKSSESRENLYSLKDKLNILSNKPDNLIEWVRGELRKNRTDTKVIDCVVDKLKIIKDMTSCYMDMRRIFPFSHNFQRDHREGPTLTDIYNKLEDISKMLSANPGMSSNSFGMPFVIQNKAINGGDCSCTNANKTNLKTLRK